MPAILGVSAYYHDSAAALIVDGEIVAAAQEERFSRVKHDHRFPRHAIDYCLHEAGLTPDKLDFVAFYDKPVLKLERLLETYLSYAPVGFRSFATAMPLWLEEKLHLPRELRKGLPGYTRRFLFPEHHESHAASAFYPSPFEEAAILTLDGVGEWATASFGAGRGNRLELTHELRFPHSLGLLYSAFTYFTGFRVNSGEYKLMGLAPYGEPRYVDLLFDKILDLQQDGSFRLDLSYFNYCQGLTMTSPAMGRLFGGPPRLPEAPLTQREMDIARSVQEVTEEVMLRAARHVFERTGYTDLCLAGGVALNCVGNGRILREGPFRRLWIQPAAGDAGGALGAALLVWYELLGNPRAPSAGDSQKGSLLGPAFSSQVVRQALDRAGTVYHTAADERQLCERAAELLAAGKVVGWFQGRMEFGPRALGNRSILGDPRRADMQSTMNLKIKYRESFRPFAPSVLEEEREEWFDLPCESPYMLLVAPVASARRLHDPLEASAVSGLDRLKARRSEIPAVTHVDGSARVQTVDAERNPLYHDLLRAFARRTACPVLINTSFNVRGEPIVCSPEEALRCFLATEMDALVMGEQIVLKEEQGEATAPARDEHLARFALD
jgi:carbamoyltransferase